MLTKAYNALQYIQNSGYVLDVLRTIPKERREEFMQAAEAASKEMAKDRPGFLTRLLEAPGRGLEKMASSIQEAIGLGGSDEEIADIDRLRGIAAGTTELAKPTDPWYERLPVQAAEMTPQIGMAAKEGLAWTATAFGLPRGQSLYREAKAGGAGTAEALASATVGAATETALFSFNPFKFAKALPAGIVKTFGGTAAIVDRVVETAANLGIGVGKGSVLMGTAEGLARLNAEVTKWAGGRGSADMLAPLTEGLKASVEAAPLMAFIHGVQVPMEMAGKIGKKPLRPQYGDMSKLPETGDVSRAQWKAANLPADSGREQSLRNAIRDDYVQRKSQTPAEPAGELNAERERAAGEVHEDVQAQEEPPVAQGPREEAGPSEGGVGIRERLPSKVPEEKVAPPEPRQTIPPEEPPPAGVGFTTELTPPPPAGTKPAEPTQTAQTTSTEGSQPDRVSFGKEPRVTGGGAMNLPLLTNPLETIRKTFQRFFTARGELPKDVYDRKISKEGEVAREMNQMRFAMGDFRRGVKKALAGRELTEANTQLMNDALRGRTPIASLPDLLQEPVQAMRDHIDSLSRRLIACGAAQGDLVGIITEHEGFYVTRSYKVFSDPKWSKKVPVEKRNQAIAYLRSEFPEKTDPEIHGLVERLLYKGIEAGAPTALLKNAGLGAKDLSTFMRRKDIPEPIRELWGEYKEAGVNYARSVFKMANLAANHRFLQDVKTAGLGKFFFEQPVITESGKHIARISSEGNKAMEPLDGLYTTPEIKAAFDRVYQPEHLPDWLRGYMAVNSTVKYSKTVASLMTHVRNFVSNTGFAVANGHWRVGKGKEAFMGTMAGLSKRGDQVWRDYYLRASELGLVGEGVRAGELRDAVRDASEVNLDEYVYNAERRHARKIANVAKIAGRAVSELYQAEDGVWKLYAWENEKARYREARPDLSVPEVEKLAADIVRDTYPTYSKVPEAIKKLRRFPVVGTFVNFPAEVIRTTFNTLDLAVRELNDPRTRAIGATRLVGTAVALTGLSALSAGTMALTGITRKDDEDLKKFVAPWQKNSRLIYLGRKPTGEFRFVDMGYSDPHSNLIEPVIAFMQGKNFKESMIAAGKAFVEPFASQEILYKAVSEASANMTETGRPVYNPEETPGQQAKDIANHFWKTLEPGTLTSARRIAMGLKGEKSASGRSFDPGIEATAVVTGQRIQELDVEQSYSFRLRDFKKSLDLVKDIGRESTHRRGTVTAEEIGSDLSRMDEQRRSLFDDFSETTRAAMRLGVNRARIQKMLKASGLSHEIQQSVLRGVYRPSRMSPESLKTVKQANPQEFRDRSSAIRRAEEELAR
jgi:hypothetical protein